MVLFFASSVFQGCLQYNNIPNLLIIKNMLTIGVMKEILSDQKKVDKTVIASSLHILACARKSQRHLPGVGLDVSYHI